MNRERHYLMLCTSFLFWFVSKKSGSKGKLRINIKADICHPSASCLLVLDRVQGKWNVPSSCASAQTASPTLEWWATRCATATYTPWRKAWPAHTVTWNHLTHVWWATRCATAIFAWLPVPTRLPSLSAWPGPPHVLVWGILVDVFHVDVHDVGCNNVHQNSSNKCELQHFKIVF